jgi:hypothetical protein
MVLLHLLRRWNSSVCFSMGGLGFKIIWQQVMYFLTNPFLLNTLPLASNAMCTENMSFYSYLQQRSALYYDSIQPSFLLTPEETLPHSFI